MTSWPFPGSSLPLLVFFGFYAGLSLQHLFYFFRSKEKGHIYYVIYSTLLIVTVVLLETPQSGFLKTLPLHGYQAGLILFSLYLVVYAIQNSVASAKEYLWALLPLPAAVLFHAAVLYGLIGDPRFSGWAVIIGAMWHMIFFSYLITGKAERKNSDADLDIQFLQSRYASMGETVGNIAHQWKQPLNAIGALQTGIKASLLYRNDTPKEKLLDSVDTSFEILRHLAETIDTFYSFLSPKTQEPTTFRVSGELEAIRKMTEYSFDNSNIRLKYELSDDPELDGNANEFMHALLNLILNARDAFDTSTTKTPLITVAVDEENGSCRIVVFDNAGGIPIEPIDLVFERHVSSKEEGSGLGLFMTRTIVEQRFGGNIAVENIEGGTRFTIILPLGSKTSRPFLPSKQSESKSLMYIKELTHKVIELEELEKTFKKWADTFWQVDWGLVIYSVEGHRIELMNPAFAGMHGFKRGELMGRALESLLSEQSLEEWHSRNAALTHKGYHSFKTLNRRNDGSTFPATFDISEIKDESGAIRYFIASVRDVTEQKEADELLRLKRFALNHIKDEVYLINESGHFHYVNDEACKQLGYDREELLEKSVMEIDPDYPAERWAQHWRQLREEKNILTETHHRRKDKTVFPVEVSTNYFEYNGRGYNLAVARNITERKKAERQLREREEKFSGIFRLSPAAVSVSSLERNIYLEVNDSFLFHTKYTRDEVLGKSSAELNIFVNPEDREELFRQVRENGVVSGLEYDFRAKDGTVGHAVAYGSVITLGGEKCFLAHSYDNAPRKQVETLKKERLELKARLSKIAEAAPGVNYIFEQKPDGKMAFTYVALGIEELIGINSRTMTSDFDAATANCHPEDHDGVIESLVSSARTLSPWHREYRIIHPEKGERWIEARSAPEKQEDGTVVWYGFFHDITERKKAEQATREINVKLEKMVRERTAELRNALAFTEGIIHAIPDLLFEVDPEGNYLNVWARDETLLTAQKEHLLGQNFRDILPKEAADVAAWTLEEVERNGRSLGNIYKLSLPDGVHWFELHMAKKEPGGTYLALARDITERKRSEEQLKALNGSKE